MLASSTMYRTENHLRQRIPYLNIEEPFGNRDDVFQIKNPARQHLDWQRQHGQKEKDGEVKTRCPKFLEIPLKHSFCQNHRQHKDIANTNQNADTFPQEDILRQRNTKAIDPDVLR